jgi:hypothetical protein
MVQVHLPQEPLMERTITSTLTVQGKYHIHKLVVPRLIEHLGLCDAVLAAPALMKAQSSSCPTLTLSDGLDVTFMEAQFMGPGKPDRFIALASSSPEAVRRPKGGVLKLIVTNQHAGALVYHIVGLAPILRASGMCEGEGFDLYLGPAPKQLTLAWRRLNGSDLPQRSGAITVAVGAAPAGAGAAAATTRLVHPSPPAPSIPTARESASPAMLGVASEHDEVCAYHHIVCSPEAGFRMPLLSVADRRQSCHPPPASDASSWHTYDIPPT